MGSSGEGAERELMAAACAGDADAFGVIVRTYLKRVYRAAYRVVRNHDDASEIAQETFLRAYRSVSTFDTSRPVFPWLYQIARNLSLNRVQRVRRRETSLPEFDAIESTMDGPEELVCRSVDERAVQRAVAALPDQQRLIIELHHFEECSYREIADILGIPIGTVMSRLFHARRRLRAILEMEDGGNGYERTTR